MILFEPKPQFDVNTGKPASPVLKRVGYLCDYCGNPIEEGCLETKYKVLEVGGSETMYEMELLEIGMRRVDLHDMYSKHPMFTYCQDWDNESFCDQRLMIEYMAMCMTQDRSADPEKLVEAVKTFLKNEKLGAPLSSRYAHRTILANMMYLARHRAIKKMLKQYSVEQLQLELNTIVL